MVAVAPSSRLRRRDQDDVLDARQGVVSVPNAPAPGAPSNTTPEMTASVPPPSPTRAAAATAAAGAPKQDAPAVPRKVDTPSVLKPVQSPTTPNSARNVPLVVGIAFGSIVAALILLYIVRRIGLCSGGRKRKAFLNQSGADDTGTMKRAIRAKSMAVHQQMQSLLAKQQSTMGSPVSSGLSTPVRNRHFEPPPRPFVDVYLGEPFESVSPTYQDPYSPRSARMAQYAADPSMESSLMYYPDSAMDGVIEDDGTCTPFLRPPPPPRARAYGQPAFVDGEQQLQSPRFAPRSNGSPRSPRICPTSPRVPYGLARRSPPESVNSGFSHTRPQRSPRRMPPTSPEGSRGQYPRNLRSPTQIASGGPRVRDPLRSPAAAPGIAFSSRRDSFAGSSNYGGSSTSSADQYRRRQRASPRSPARLSPPVSARRVEPPPSARRRDDGSPRQRAFS